MEFRELNTLMFPSRFVTVFVLQKNMEAVKVEPDSDDDTHRMFPQDEYCMTDQKDGYPVHAELFVVKGEHEVSSRIHHYLFNYYLALYCYVHVVCHCIWSVVCFTGMSQLPIMSQ